MFRRFIYFTNYFKQWYQWYLVTYTKQYEYNNLYLYSGCRSVRKYSYNDCYSKCCNGSNVYSGSSNLCRRFILITNYI